MRPAALAVLAVLAALAACSSVPAPVTGPESETEAALAAAVEDALADVVAAASAPETDAAAFARLVAYRGGDLSRSYKSPANPGAPTERAAAAALLATLRSIIGDRRGPDGRFVYQVVEFVHEPTDLADWHVLRLDVGVLEDDRTSEVEVAFVPGPGGFLLGRIAD